MRLENLRPTVYRMTLHTYELAALISAARWVEEGAEGELPREVTKQLTTLLTSYDEQARRLQESRKKT